MSGFIAMQRDALDHPLLRDAERFRAWFWIVAHAAWKPTKFDIRGSLVPIGRGQLCVSIRQLADDWGWSKSAVDRFLTRLETETMIEREAGHGRCIITVCNYAKYQDGEKADRDTSGTPTGTPAGHQRDTKEQGNKGTREPSGSTTKAARKGPIQADWLPAAFGDGTESRRVEDGWPPGERAAQIEQFKAHHRAKGSVFNDPQSAWSTWVLNSRKFGNVRQHPQHSRPTTRDIGERVAARFAAGSSFADDRLPRLGSSGGNG